MRRIAISAKAQADIETIADFIAADNALQALRFIKASQVRSPSLELHPLQRRPSPQFGEGVRLLVLLFHVVLHRVFADRVAFDRVIHGARDRSMLACDE